MEFMANLFPHSQRRRDESQIFRGIGDFLVGSGKKKNILGFFYIDILDT